jgi:23S rRNA pseudouridine2605 synthase
VRANGRITQEALDALADGVTIEGVRYGPTEAKLDRSQGANAWLTLALREGKNREVRRIMGYLGLSVTRLIRVSFGPFALGDLQPGAVEEVKRRVLADQLGPEMTERFSLREKKQHRTQEGQKRGAAQTAKGTARPAAAKKAARRPRRPQ